VGRLRGTDVRPGGRAAAVVLTTRERARELPGIAIEILGEGMQFHGAPCANPVVYRDIRRLGMDAGWHIGQAAR
jgi:hypothetical protein